MANTLTQVGIETGNAVEAYHVTQSIDAFTGTVAYDISLSGSFNMTGSINGEPGVINPLTASYASTASYAPNFANTDLTLSSPRTHTIGSQYLLIASDPSFSILSPFIYFSNSLVQIGSYTPSEGIYTEYDGNFEIGRAHV